MVGFESRPQPKSPISDEIGINLTTVVVAADHLETVMRV